MATHGVITAGQLPLGVVILRCSSGAEPTIVLGIMTLAEVSLWAAVSRHFSNVKRMATLGIT